MTPLRVDLKWSLWSKDKEHWDEYAPGVWEKLASLGEGECAEVHTAPRKAIRFGEVLIARMEASEWVARVNFRDGDSDDIVEDVGPGESFEALMGEVDEVEARLIEDEVGE